MKTTIAGLLRAAASITIAALASCGVEMDQYGKPTFALDAGALAQLVADWQSTNNAKDASVFVVPSVNGQTLVATMPNGSVITETINPNGVFVK